MDRSEPQEVTCPVYVLNKTDAFSRKVLAWSDLFKPNEMLGMASLSDGPAC
jgi:hypothetical protein